MFDSNYFCIFNLIEIKYSKRKTDGGSTIDITTRTGTERLFWERWDLELEDNYKKLNDKKIDTYNLDN